MCGFAGFFGAGDRRDLAVMTGRLVHRGPDDEAFRVDESHRAFLGFRRLIVIDPAGGAQPMESAAHGLAVVFNGEIYNHRELRAELEALGHRFVSDHADTEVLLHGYAAWGDALPERLEGMFAFAIWDKRRRRLFCARDRFGEKPFYWLKSANLFAFASEITALHSHSAVIDAFDPLSVQRFFAYGYVPAPDTIYRAARKLPPGSILTLDLGSGDAPGEPKVSRYWRFRIEAEPHAPAERIGLLAEELRALLRQAVRRRLEADVPLGVFLSGGLDSTGVLALAGEAVGPVDAFTIGFDEPSYDESAYARQAATALGARHHLRTLGLAAARADLPALLASLDEPFADPSVLPTHLLARFARERITVALTGDGGDELFAGYDPFSALAPARLYRRLTPPPLHRLARAAAGRLPRGRRNMSLDYRLSRALRGLSHAPAMWNPVWLGALAPEDFAACFEDPAPPEQLYERAIALWNESGARSDIDRTLEFYTNFYLPEMILAKTDRASMRASLECRTPFLDGDLAAFCQRLPAGYKLRNGTRKFLLKEALRGLVPDRVIDRAKKGFGIPLVDWLGDLEPLGHGPTPAGMRPGFSEARWRAFREGREDERLFLWGRLCLAQVGGSP